MTRLTLQASTLALLSLATTSARAGDEFSLLRWASEHSTTDGAAACLACRAGLPDSLSWSLGADADRSLFVDPATGRNMLNYPPHRVVDFTNMKLDIRIADMNRPVLEGKETLSFTPIAEDAHDLTLDAKRLQIKSVSVKGTKATFTHDGLKMVVSFDPPLPAEKPAELVIEYTSTNPPEGLFWTPESIAWPGRAAQIHTQGEPETNSFWFPCRDFPNDKLTTELTVTVPRGYVVSSNGRLVKRSTTITPMPDAFGKTSLVPFDTWSWAQDEKAGGAHVNYLVTMVVGKFDVVDVAGARADTPSSTGLPRPRGYESPLARYFAKPLASAAPRIEMPVYVPPGRGGDVVQTYGRTADMVRFFSALLDEPFPWAKYSQLVVHNFAFGGMENTSATTMFDTAILSKDALLDHDQDGLISHELAHQWFGDLITCNSWEHIWLNEGFATYMTGLWFEHRDGSDAYVSASLGFFDGVIGADQGKAPETPGMVSKAYRNPVEALRRSSNPYGKGASILHMLRRKLGDEVFFAGLREYLNRFGHKTAETDDLRKTLEDVSGESLQQFFTQWTSRSGVPRLKIAASHAGSTLSVAVTQTQAIDGYNPAFVFDLPIVVKDASGKVTRHVLAVDARDESLSIELAEPPVWVAVDPDLSVLAEMILEEPKDWLAREAVDGPSLASRIHAVRTISKGADQTERDVLVGLAQSPTVNRQLRNESLHALEVLGDASLALKLAADLKTDPYVRIQALDSLTAVASKAPAGDELRAAAARVLEQAMRDPAVRARASAIRGLASLKVEGQIPAILAMGSRDKAHDSQHDVIRQSVADALPGLDSPDAFKVAIEMSRPGTNSFTRAKSVAAIAKLAKHGPDVAIAALGNYLSDPEIRARRSAINGLGEIGTEQAIAVLRARIPGVTSPYEQADIERIVRDWESKQNAK